jgi:hypothetical protein
VVLREVATLCQALVYILDSGLRRAEVRTASTKERTQGFSEIGVDEVESEFLILLISRA